MRLTNNYVFLLNQVFANKILATLERLRTGSFCRSFRGRQIGGDRPELTYLEVASGAAPA